MLNAGVLTFQEFAMGESLPLATIQEAMLEFLRGRDDVVLFGAQAVNAYVDESPRTGVILLCFCSCFRISNANPDLSAIA